MRILLLACIGCLLSFSLHAQLNGTFTIGGTTPDYNTLSDAVADLSNVGVSGPVTFQIREGVYAESIQLYDPISGSSAINTVTFQSEAGDSTKVTIASAGSTVLDLSDLSYVIFQDLSFYSTGYEVAYLYNCRYLQFRRVSFKGDASQTNYGLYLSDNCTGLQLQNVVVTGTSNYSLYMDLYATSELVSISQSHFSGGAGLYLSDLENAIVQSNEIQPAESYEYGLYAYNSSGMVVSDNQIRLEQEGQQGIYLYESNNSNIANNQIAINADYSTGMQVDYGSDQSVISHNAIAIQGNEVTGLYLYAGNISLLNNQIEYQSGNGGDGIYTSSYDGPMQILGNRILGLSGGTGIYLSSLYANGEGTSLIANNFIQSGGSNTGYGIYLGDGESIDILHNSIHQTSTDSYSAALYYSYGSDIRIGNNVLAASGGAYALSIDNDGSDLGLCDYNNLFSTGSNLVNFDYSDYADLAAWQAAGTFGQHSLSLDPQFTSATDLHSSQVGLNAAALSGLGVSTDIDGESRSSSPDIGADEFSVAGLDAAISLLSPSLPLAPAELEISINLANTAAEVITAVSLQWSVNGVAQAGVNWTGNLGENASTAVILGNYTFMAGATYDLEISITDVNSGATQLTTANDLIQISGAQTAMAGYYTIGGSDPDFATITDAVEALYTIGVADEVIFLLRSGTYTDQLYFEGPVTGVGSDHPITFRSEAMDASAVEINYDGYPIYLYDIGYLNFSDVSFRSLSENSSVVYTENTNDLSFVNCNLIGHTDSNSDVAYFSSFGSNLNFEQCTIQNGYQGITVYPRSASSGFQVTNCTFAQVETGIYASNGLVGPIIRNNQVSANGYYGIVFYDTGGNLDITGNTIFFTPTSGGAAIYLNYANGGLVANNFISVDGSGSGQGIYGYEANQVSIVHNTVSVRSGETSSVAIQLDYGTGSQVINNIAANFAGGFALADRYGSHTYNYNDLYSSGTSLVDKNYNPLSDLAAWQAASGQATNSISENPLFVSATDLHVQAAALDGAATAGTGIGTDIDGDARDATMPDIGADEFDRYPQDVALIRLLAPEAPVNLESREVIIELINLATESLTSLTIDWSVNGQSQSSLNWAGALAEGGILELNLGTFDFSAGGSFLIEATAYNPNNLPDLNPANNVLQATVETALIGTYTVGVGTTDFTTISEAIEALHQRGAAGAVTFSLLPGTYEEQISIGDFPGNDLYPIRLESQALDYNTVLWQFPATSGANYVLLLDGVRDLSIEGIHLKAQEVSFYAGTVIAHQSGEALSLSNNWLEGTIATSGQFQKSIIRHSNTFLNRLSLHNNRFDLGSYALYSYNSPSQYGAEVIINGNSFQNQIYTLLISYMNAVTVTDNTFSVSHSGNYFGLQAQNGQMATVQGNIFTGNNNGEAISLNHFSGSVSISKNQIFGLSTGINFQNITAGSIINNFISVGTTNQNAYGIRGSNSSLSIFHNSVLNSSSLQSINSAALSLYSSGNYEIKNNILASTGGALVVSLSNSGTYTSDFNDLYGTGNIWGIWSNNFRYNLAEWQAASGLDANSISEAPQFAGANDLHISQAALNAAGTPTAGVGEDIDGDPRDPNTPDIGADEFPYASADILPVSLASPSSLCADDEVYLMVDIKNQGANDATGFVIRILEGESVLVEENVGAFLLPPGQTGTYTFQTALDLSTPGTPTLQILTQLEGDGDTENDALEVSLEIWSLPVLTLGSNSPVCAGETIQLNSSAGQFYQWTGPNDFSDNTQNPALVEAHTGQSGTYEVTITDANGCQAAGSTMVVVHEKPTATAASNSPVCAGSNLELTASGGTSYQWSGPVGFSSTDPFPVLENVSPAMAGTYTVTVTDANLCQATATTEVLIQHVPGTISQNGPLCVGEDLQLQAGGGETYNWSGPNGFTSILPNPMIESVTTLESGQYEVTITGTNTCTQELSTTLVVNELPEAMIDPEATSVCGGLPLTLTASGGATYAWSTGDNSAEITLSPLSTTTYTVTVTSAAACQDIASVTIEVENTAPYFAFTGNEGFTDAVVSPLQGSPYQTFRFEIDYFDTDGDLPGPSFPRLLLDFNNNGSYSDESDQIFVMTEADASDTDVTDGKRYFYQVTGLNTSMQYRTAFLAQDASGCNSQAFTPLDQPNVVDFADLSIYANDITFSNDNPDPGTPLQVSATIHNNSDFSADNFWVRAVNQFSNEIYPDIVVPQLPAHSTTTVSWTIITPEVVSWNPIQVFIDQTNVIEEPNELDNQAIRPFINGEYNLPGTILVEPTVSPEVSISGSSNITLSGTAIYDGTAVPLSDPSVAGATVQFTLTETGQTFSTYTNSQGRFSYGFKPPLTPGLYHLTGTITDFTLTGTFTEEFVIQPAPCKPDLQCSFQMEAGSVVAGGALNGAIAVTNSGCATSATSSLLDVSGQLGTPIPADVIIPALAPGESFLYEFPAPVNFNTVGTARLQAIADASLIVVESNEQNNTCLSSIRVKPDLPDIRIAYIANGGQKYQCYENGFTVKLENIGGVSTGAFQVERVIRRLGDDVVEYSDVVTIDNIGSGSYVYSSFEHDFAQTGNYRVEIYADIPTAPEHGVVEELDESNNVATTNLSLVACLPDLKLAGSLTLSPQDPHTSATVELTAQLKNEGNADVAEDIVVRFEMGGNTLEVTHEGGLNVGQSVPVSVIMPTPEATCAEVLIVADAPGLIAEVSEANNTQLSPLSYDFYLGNYCSFTAKKFWQKPQKVNQPVNFQVGLYNDGFFTASSVAVRFEISGPGISGWLDWGTTSLNQIGKTFSCPYVISASTAYVFTQTGTYYVRMTADPTGDYPECDEGNNVLTVPVSVVEDRPDLRILSQYIAPSKLNPDVGEEVTFSITYENIGKNNIGDDFQLRWEVNEMVQDEVPAIGLNTGDTWTLEMPSTWSSVIPGIHIVRATIDSGEEIAENDELNNEATRAILVGQYPNLFFDQVTVSEPNPAQNDLIDLDFEVVNEGDLSCDADLQLFYVNDFGDTILFETFPIQVPANSRESFQRNWQVIDPATTIVFRIVNADPEEFNLTDNEVMLQLGQLAVSAAVSSEESCPGSADGTAVVSASGGQPPYLIQWSEGTSGSILTAGAGTYQVSVTDQAGHSATAAVTISTSPDAELPLIFNGPGDINLTVTDGNCPVAVNWTAPEASDNCTLVSFESDYEPGALFPAGVTTVTYTATDQAGNTRSYTFDVIINGLPIALAGADQLICGAEAVLDANTPEFGNGQWTILEGSAIFEDPTDPLSAVSELAGGPNRFRWEVTNGGCGSAADELTIISDPAAYDFGGMHFAPPIPNVPNANLTANWEITDGDGWTHYYQCAEDGGSGYLLLSIYKDGQHIGQLGDNLQVRNITVPSYGSNQAHDLSEADYVETDGWFVFGRYWDVETDQEPMEPILVRYYYSPEDTLALKQTIEMNGGVWDDDEAMRFFKVSGEGIGPFDLDVISSGGAYLEYENGGTPSLDTWAKGHFKGLMYAEYYVSSFSGGGGGGSPGPEGLLGALPLELLSFTAARTQPEAVLLEWTTINEIVVNGFQLQRSLGGNSWANVGWVDSQGDNTEMQFYEFVDRQAPASTAYYRLEMHDLDGTITYSPIVSVEPVAPKTELRLYPNPTTGVFHLLVEGQELVGNEVQITISDVMGRRLLEHNFDIQHPETSIRIDELTNRPAGVYTIMIRKKGVIMQVLRVVKD